MSHPAYFAIERAQLEREKLQLIAARGAFERDKEREWAAIGRARQLQDEERAEVSRLKIELLTGITTYFKKKAELEGGLIPAPEAPANPSPTSPSRSHSAHHSADHSAVDANEVEHPEPPPLKRKRGRPLKRKRGRPPLQKDAVAPDASNDGDASEDSIQEPKKRGRKKVYHLTEYGTRLPLVHLQGDGTTMDANELQEKDPRGWQNVIRVIKNHHQAAPFRFRAWVEKKSKDCLQSYIGLQKKTRWSAGLDRRGACKECQKSNTPCIILDANGTEMVLLPRADSP